MFLGENKEFLQNSLTDFWRFKLYICGETPRAAKAYSNLKKVCDERLDAKYTIEVVDLTKNPDAAQKDNITACPTLVKEAPGPKARVIGDLSKTEKVLEKLDLPPSSLKPPRFDKARSVGFDLSHFLS